MISEYYTTNLQNDEEKQAASKLASCCVLIAKEILDLVLDGKISKKTTPKDLANIIISRKLETFKDKFCGYVGIILPSGGKACEDVTGLALNSVSILCGQILGNVIEKVLTSLNLNDFYTQAMEKLTKIQDSAKLQFVQYACGGLFCSSGDSNCLMSSQVSIEGFDLPFSGPKVNDDGSNCHGRRVEMSILFLVLLLLIYYIE
jgi:hypothetical protein